MLIPAAKLGEVYVTGCLDCPDEVVGGDCLAVVLRKVVPTAFEKTLRSHQQAQHPDDLSPLDVNRQGVKVIDLNKRVRADGMSHWPCVFAELLGANQIGILDPLDAGRVMISAELLLTKDGKTFLEAELKPVAQGYPVARPVVQVLMTDNIANGAVVLVGCRGRLREYVAGIEDIETLVLHGAHVEVFHRNNVVLIQIVFAAVHFFVPDHRVAKRAQGKITLGDITRAGVNP